jgi:hypothetical protein
MKKGKAKIIIESIGVGEPFIPADEIPGHVIDEARLDELIKNLTVTYASLGASILLDSYEKEMEDKFKVARQALKDYVMGREE